MKIHAKTNTPISIVKEHCIMEGIVDARPEQCRAASKFK